MSESTTIPPAPSHSSRGSRSGTRSKLKALRAEIKSKLTASQTRIERTLAEAAESQRRIEQAFAESQQRIQAALDEAKQTREDLLVVVDEALAEASSSSSRSRSSAGNTPKNTATEISEQESSVEVATEQVLPDRGVEQAPHAEQPEPAVESAQSHPESPSRVAPAQAAKPGTIPKDGAGVEFDDLPVTELSPELSKWCAESTHPYAQEGIGTQYYSSTVYSGHEPTRVDTPVACSEMSRDTKYIYSLSHDARAMSSGLLDATRDALDPMGVERHGSVASAPSASAQRTALDRHHRPLVLDHFHTLGSQPERPSGEPDAHAAPTRVRTRVRNWLADLPSVQSVATDDLVPRGTRSPLLSSPAPRLSPLVSRLDLRGLPLESSDSGNLSRGSGDMQPSHATQDLNEARSSSAPSSRTERTMKDAERGEQKEYRETASDSEEEEETKGQREEGCGASRKHEHEGSTPAGTYSPYVFAWPPPLPVPASVGVTTNEGFAVRTTDHEDGMSVPRYDCEVVPDTPCGSTSVLRDDFQVVHPTHPSMPGPTGVSTNAKIVVRPVDHAHRTHGPRYNLQAVPGSTHGDTVDAHDCMSDVPCGSMNAPRASATNGTFVVRTGGHEDRVDAIRDDLTVVPSTLQDGTLAPWDDLAVVPYTQQGDTTDAQYRTSDVPHHSATGYRVADTPQADISTSTPIPLCAPVSTSVATNEEFVVRVAGQGDGRSVMQDDLPVVPADLQGHTPALRDDLAVVPPISQSDTADAQQCTSDGPHSPITDRWIASTPRLMLDVHATDQHEGSRTEGTPLMDVSISTPPTFPAEAGEADGKGPAEGGEGEGCGASRESEQEGSQVEGTPMLDEPTSPPPVPVPLRACVSMNTEFIERTAGHGTRYDCEVVSFSPQNSTSVLRYDLQIVPGPSTWQSDTADVQYRTSDVPHWSATGCRVTALRLTASERRTDDGPGRRPATTENEGQRRATTTDGGLIDDGRTKDGERRTTATNGNGDSDERRQRDSDRRTATATNGDSATATDERTTTTHDDARRRTTTQRTTTHHDDARRRRTTTTESDRRTTTHDDGLPDYDRIDCPTMTGSTARL
ncbi:uncharacterized protein B0H18DRAFT_1220247 [Fomitopsis serialis]|uniref:uncharacterized protein n=1 Tax=Fomitopsis serialis TaxID=139415 RepID=UPI00200885E4|nr:uncharacterized protein B0H18DRAFT_1220247 [Neoantrodia serialis]KAH9907689.1 hypothetical protein B0H18DRAFT_1220247 [Neoantrodia serialis]